MILYLAKAGPTLAIRNPRPEDHSEGSAPRLSPLPTLALRPLTVADMPAFRDLRLDALRRHPEAFIPTYGEERSVDPQRLSPDVRYNWIRNGNFVLGAFFDGTLTGAIGVQRWSRQKQCHKATIWMLYIDDAARGRGLGRRLLLTAIDRCRQEPDLELLHLSVGAESAAARQLYASVGFETYGREPQAIKLDDRYIDVECMALRLRPAF